MWSKSREAQRATQKCKARRYTHQGITRRDTWIRMGSKMHALLRSLASLDPLAGDHHLAHEDIDGVALSL